MDLLSWSPLALVLNGDLLGEEHKTPESISKRFEDGGVNPEPPPIAKGGGGDNIELLLNGCEGGMKLLDKLELGNAIDDIWFGDILGEAEIGGKALKEESF